MPAKMGKDRRVASKGRGWERKKAEGNPRVLRIGGLGPVLGYSLAILKIF